MNKKGRLISLVLVLSLLFGVIYFNGEINAKQFYLSEKTVVAMNTVVTFKLYQKNDDVNLAEETLSQMQGIVDELESEISWRKDNSKIALLNKDAQINDEEIATILSACNQVSNLSDGKFDITSGKLSQLWDIGGENEKIPTESELKDVLKTVGYEKIVIDDSIIKIGENQAIDLGAIGKGLACDELETYLENSDIDGGIISVGGSILAFGDFDENNSPWQIAIQHPRDEDSMLGIVKIDEGFVSTSGDYERYFVENSKRYHHILDATTGYPSQSDLISVSVVCDNGLLSDALSTAIFAVGSEKAESILKQYDASAVLVLDDLSIKTIGEIEFESLI